MFTVRDQQVTVPGVATILRRLIDTGGFDQGLGTSRQPTSTVTTLFADPSFPYTVNGGGGGGPRLLTGGPGSVARSRRPRGSGPSATGRTSRASRPTRA